MDLKQVKLSQQLSDKLDKIIDFKLSTHFGEQEALKHVKACMRITLENLLNFKLIFGE